MTLQTLASLIVAATILGLPSAPLCAEPPTLSPEQDKTAACMLSVVRSEPNVSDAKLTVQAGTGLSGAPAGPPRAFIDYTFNHRIDSSGVFRTHVVARTAMHEEITQFLPPMSKPNMIIGLSGLSPVGAAEGWLNDHNNGLWDIIPGWSRKCGVPIGAMTI